jgi:fumarate reductase subunit C
LCQLRAKGAEWRRSLAKAFFPAHAALVYQSRCEDIPVGEGAAVQSSKLTAQWVAGREQPYMNPLQLFLVVNVFYFIFIHFVPISTLTNPLEVQKNRQIFSTMIQPIIKEKIKSSGMDSVQFEKSYNETSSSQAKTLVILMAPVFAILTSLLYFYKRRYFVEHLVFSIHFYAFFMIVESLVVALVGLITELISGIFSISLNAEDWDSILSFFPGIVVLVYLFIALKRVFGGSWWATGIKSFALTYAVLYIIFLYRFILFFTTIYTMDTGK